MSKTEMESMVEKVLALQKEAEDLRQMAKAEALERMDKARKELEQLGFHYKILEAKNQQVPAARLSGHTRQRGDGPCPICNFKTKPPHDGRKHRAQVQKKPFTEFELSELGLEKVE